MCYVCGQQWCGSCNSGLAAGGFDTCPTCRAPIDVSDTQDFHDLKNLVETREPGRHTVTAQISLAHMYSTGKGVAQSVARAFAFCKRAADTGDAKGQYNLGVMYEQGEGVTQDKAKAATLYGKASGQGFAKAGYNLGLLHYKGQGMPKNTAEGCRWPVNHNS